MALRMFERMRAIDIVAGAVGAAGAVALMEMLMIAMHLTKTFHPPAGIDPLVVVVNNMPWAFLLVPVAVGALLLAAFAFVWHRVTRHGDTREGAWPQRWW